MKRVMKMAEIVIKTSLSNINLETVYNNIYNHQKLKILFDSMIAIIDYEKDVSVQTNCDLKGHFVSFTIKDVITNNTYDEEKDIKIIKTSTLELTLEKIKQLNPLFLDVISFDENGFACYII